MYFVDHDSKAVFSGESLGEGYRVEALRQRCGKKMTEELELGERQRLRLGGL